MKLKDSAICRERVYAYPAIKNKIMKKKIALFFALLILFVVTGRDLSLQVYAQERKDAFLQTRFYIQGSYLMNFDNSNSGVNDFRYLDPRSNFISPDLLEILLNQEPWKSRLGFKIRITGGEYARKLHARGLGTADNYVDLSEFFISYLVPIGNGVKISIGKIFTDIGAEYLESLDNPNYSNSFLYTYAEPSTHTGVKLNYDFSKQVSLIGLLANGWDNFSDNNTAKTTGLSLVVRPYENTELWLNVLNGPEKDNNNIDNRFFFDWVGNFKLSKNFSIIASYDYGKEQNFTADGEAAVWSGYSLIGKYDFTDKIGFSVRFDKFNDRDSFRTGVSQILKEVTFTPSFKLGENVYIRPEYRIDWSTVNSFDNGNSNMQRTLGVGVMLNW